MSNIYIYHNNLISLLNLIDFLLQKKIKPDNIKDNSFNATLLDRTVILNLKEDENIIGKIIKKLNAKIFNIIYYIYLSNQENKELIIYYFLLNAYKYPDKILALRNLRCVNLSLKIAKQVGNEAHKLKGFVRFKELDNKVLYAKINPDNNVLFLLAKHFKRRLPHEYFMIHDINRKILALYDKKEIYLINEDNLNLKNLKESENEKEMENLWKSFYQTIGIKERKNEKCRMNFMPKKYWQYIIEMSEEL